MVNAQVLQGSWNEASGLIQEKWSQLTNEDLGEFRGDLDQLVGRIQQRTGESRESVEHFLSQMSEELTSGLDGWKTVIKDAAQQASEKVTEGYNEAEEFVRNRPGQSLAIALGIGLVAGLGLALMVRDRHEASVMQRGRVVSEQMGRQLLDAIVQALPESVSSKLRS